MGTDQFVLGKILYVILFRSSYNPNLSVRHLMQAIARVNRVFKDKPGGLIVDYIGIGSFLKEALAAYTKTEKKENVVNQEDAVAVMLEKYEICRYVP